LGSGLSWPMFEPRLLLLFGIMTLQSSVGIMIPLP
jgi:hypothetical protein